MTFLRTVIALVFLFITPVVFAANSPELIAPANSSTVSSTSLSWQPVENAVQYRVVVDDESEVTSPYLKNYYASKTAYSPKLENGTFYWKVGAKDSTGNWTWSPVWSFTLNQSDENISSNKSDTKDTKSSSFVISNVPKTVTSEQSFKVKIDLSIPKNPNAKFYLKGSFKKADGSNYFGLSKILDWAKNGDAYTKQPLITIDSNGYWSGELEIKVDTSDSGFNGSGDYTFKVARYTETGSGPTWSNEEMINIKEVSSNPSPSPSKASSPYPKSSIQKEVLGESSDTADESIVPEEKPSALVASDSQSGGINIFVLIGIIFVGLGAGLVIYFYFKNAKNH